jgi:hypothetical protein
MSDQLLRLEYVDPRTLGANPLNWRVHPEGQRAAFAQLLEQVGWVLPLCYNERTRRLIDGHMRLADAVARGLPAVPVVIGAWTEAQERKILATLDPIGDMAGGDSAAFALLLGALDDATGPLMELCSATADALGIYHDAGAEAGEEVIEDHPPEADGEAEPESPPVADGSAPLPGRGDVPDAVFPSDNEWGVPTLDPAMQADAFDFPVEQWGNVGMRASMRGTWGFYVEDRKFLALWDDPTKVLHAGAVNAIEVNFSTHEQHPRALTLFDVYRKRWLARYWQTKGLRIFVDLNVNDAATELNLLGVPKGWRAYATRSHDGGGRIPRHFEVAAEHAGTEAILFLVCGGGKEIEELAGRRGWKWVPEPRTVAHTQPRSRRSKPSDGR